MQLEDFSHKKILLLQGPVGPFFKHLAQDLIQHQAEVIKVNFNGGDTFFYPSGLLYCGAIKDFPVYLTELVIKHQIDTIMLFGDCRPIHKIAKDTLAGFPIEWYIFEEGYLRPNHITCEKNGVNGYSQFPKQVSALLKQNMDWELFDEPVIEVGTTFKYAAMWAMVYYFMAHIFRFKYPHYQHHRPLTMTEAWPWVKSAYLKLKYKFQERNIEDYLYTHKMKQYYLVPLQTYNDAQISHHSNYACIEDFIGEVLASFAQHADPQKVLVIKQHPFDRGYRNYQSCITQCAKKYAIQDRVFYIHDQYLPTLINNSCGVVVVNSTVGMTAVESFIPVKVCGKAIYDLEKITMQCRLDDFWQGSLSWQVDAHLIQNYVTYLRHSTQFNGSFYKKIDVLDNASGVVWNKQLDVRMSLDHEYEPVATGTKSKV